MTRFSASSAALGAPADLQQRPLGIRLEALGVAEEAVARLSEASRSFMVDARRLVPPEEPDRSAPRTSWVARLNIVDRARPAPQVRSG